MFGRGDVDGIVASAAPDVTIGLDGNANLMANMSLPPVEITEAEQPLQILCTEFIQDVGGPGKYRGGMSIRRDYKLLAEEAVLQVRADRHDIRS